MKYVLLLLLVLSSRLGFGQELDKKHRQTVSDFIALVKQQDKQKLAKSVSYPLKRQYPLPAVKNANEFIKRYDEIFDQAFKERIIHSKVASDWQAVGWRGIMLLQGDLWLDYDGRLIAVNHQSELENNKRNALLRSEKSQLHPSLKNYENPVCVFETASYLIRIDDLGNSNYRYASWKRNSSMRSKPDLVINKGEFIPDGSGGNHSYVFKNGKYSFVCAIIVMGEKGAPPARLTVYKDGKSILAQKALKFKP